MACQGFAQGKLTLAQAQTRMLFIWSSQGAWLSMAVHGRRTVRRDDRIEPMEHIHPDHSCGRFVLNVKAWSELCFHLSLPLVSHMCRPDLCAMSTGMIDLNFGKVLWVWTVSSFTSSIPVFTGLARLLWSIFSSYHGIMVPAICINVPITGILTCT